IARLPHAARRGLENSKPPPPALYNKRRLTNTPAYLSPFVVLQREEVTNGMQNAAAFAAQALALCGQVQTVAGGLELHATRGEHTGNLAGDLRAVLDDPFQILAVDAQALHVVLGDHRGFTGLSGHQRHFAEEIGGFEHGDLTLVTVRSAHAHGGAALEQHVEPVRLGALASDDFTATKRR